MTAVREKLTAFAEHPFVRWFLQPRRIPLYYAVIIMTAIFYHYSAPGLTWVWFLLSLAVQSALFRLFDFVKKRPILGGAAYVGAGIVFMALALWLTQAGYDGAIFSPDGRENQIYFYVWFLTPQSVLAAEYVGYTIALFLFFSFFIGSIAYYFSFVRYRVLMSFMVMMFPFAIYAKENETMPVPFIILLFAGYFALMIYCRQASAGDSGVTAPYQPGVAPELTVPDRKSAFYGKRPEVIDNRFLKAAGLFVTAACIAVLVLPKPIVNADRQFLDTMLDMSSLSDYLMSMISGFNDKSDGGDYAQLSFNRTLYYANAEEPLNLRVRTFTDYDYLKDEWSASAADEQPDREDYRFNREYIAMQGANSIGVRSVSPEPLPYLLVNQIVQAVQEHPELASEYGLTGLSAVDGDRYLKKAEIEAASYNLGTLPAPLDTYSVSDVNTGFQLFRNLSGILFRYGDNRYFREHYTVHYVSPKITEDAAVQAVISKLSMNDYTNLLLKLQSYYPESDVVADAVESCLTAQLYARSVNSQTTAEVQALANRLTAGLHSDYEKAMAIYNFLKFGEFTYSLTYPITDADNVQTFLFQNKTGVCYQFATAMAELGRAAGLTVRYVEGYSMSQKYDRLTGDWDYMITTEHGHAFTDVFIPGFGWMMVDATAGSVQAEQEKNNVNVIWTLQYSGMILFAAAVVLVFVLVWLVPFASERLFRSRYRRQRNGKAVQAAFARLRKQWKADPALTPRVLCAQMGEFLQTDLTPLAEGVEETVYADRCTEQTADRVYEAYLRAYKAWKPAQRRKRKEARSKQRAAQATA